MEQTQSSGIDWTAIINQTISQVPSWIAIARNQPVPVAVPPGTVGGSVQFGQSGVAASFSPGIIIAGIVVVVALVFVLRK